MRAGNRMAVGIACALVGAVLWGFSGSCMQFLFAHCEISALFITVVRMIGAGLLFLVLLAVRQRDVLRGILADRASLARLAVFGSFGLFLCQVTYILTIDYTNAGTATVLQGLNMVFVLAATCVMARRAPTGREFAAVLLALASIVFIATKGDLGALNIPVEGLVWGITTAAATAFYIMYPRSLFEKWGSMPVTGLGMLVGGIAAAVVFAFCHLVGAGQAAIVPQLDAVGALALAAIVLVGTFGAFGLYLHGVSIAGSVRGSLLGAVEPVSATVLSALWLGTQFAWADWLGLALMVVTIVLVSLRPS